VSVTVDEILVPGSVEAWRAIGFSVDDDGTCRVGGVRIRPGVAGVAGWSLRGIDVEDEDVDGIRTSGSDAAPSTAAEHPNGVTQIDHVVVMTADVDRTVNAVQQQLELDVRRERDGGPMRQVFFRVGELVVEVVGPHEPGRGPAHLWGITFTVADLDATAALLGERVGRVKDAVQPGRRITTLRGVDEGVAIAFISPPADR